MPKVAAANQKGAESVGRQPVRDPMTIEQLIEVSGMPPSYVMGLIHAGVVAPATEADGRVRSVGLPMLLLQDEVTGAVVAGKLPAELAERVVNQIRPSLEYLWKDVLTRDLLTVTVHVPAGQQIPSVTVQLGFLQDASTKWRRAVGIAVAPRPKK